MSKPRDRSGNDFIVPCAFLAEELFFARFKRHSDPKSASDSALLRKMAEDFYSVALKHWKVLRP